jgi:hypothetical protein
MKPLGEFTARWMVGEAGKEESKRSRLKDAGLEPIRFAVVAVLGFAKPFQIYFLFL